MPLPPAVRAPLLSGFTLAAGPLAPTTIHTDARGVVGAGIRIPTPSGPIRGYLARPAAAKGKLPVVLVVHEIFGVHEHIKDVCRRFAKRGYVAVAPDLFGRQGDVSRLKEQADIMRVVAQVPDDQVLSDLDAAAAAAVARGRGDAEKVGLVGFCWGGRVAWLYAAHAPTLKGAVAFYGRLVGGAGDPVHPRNPVDTAGELKAPVLGLYAAQDAVISGADVQAMRQALASAGPKNPAAEKSYIHVYNNVGHGFFADYRATYDRAAANDAWHRVEVALDSYGLR